MTLPRSTAELTVTERGFLRAGRPHQIVSAAIHYFRVHPELWEDRLLRLRAMGVNTVETYIAWNLHQPAPGRPTSPDRPMSPASCAPLPGSTWT